MKLKLWITSILLTGIVIYTLISRIFILRDILFLYLLFLILTLIVISIEYLVKKSISFRDLIKSKVLGHLLSVVFILCFFGYYKSAKPIAKETAISDLNFMIESLEKIHPDIYHVISRDSFLVEFKNEIDNMPIKISELEFYKICARLTSHFRTGHTKPFTHLKSQFIFGREFPYETKIIDDRLFVVKNLSIFSPVPVGSEIVEINNKNINQLIEEWSKLVSYEHQAFRNHLITQPINIGVWNDFKSFKIKYIDFKSQKIKINRVSGSIQSNIISLIKSQKGKPEELQYKELAADIGYIGFFACMDLENYRSFFQSTFREINTSEIEHLIIDIRDNGGGFSLIPEELMQYIFHQPYNEIDSAITKVSDELIATGKVKEKLGDLKNVEVGKSYTRIPGLRQLREEPLRFQGNTYLLTNTATFSAAQGFASTFRCYGVGPIIGEETGGATVNFGNIHIFRLPHTGKQIMTSWEQAFSSCGEDNQRGVIPDYIVKNSIEDYINNTDAVLEFTLNMINNKK